MTRRYTRETPEQLSAVSAVYAVVRLSDGTTYEGRYGLVCGEMVTDSFDARMLPERIARGEVTPVPVDINQEAAKFARAKKR